MATQLRIIIAEDDRSAAELLQLQLEALGHRVVGVAHDGETAVALAERLPVDLLLLDIGLPTLDGLGAAERILEEKAVPVVLLTGLFDEETIARAARLPVFQYLLKPVTPEQLAPAISVARARFDEWNRVRNETETLSKRLDDRTTIDEAKALLMNIRGLSEREAYALLRRESQNRNQTMAEIARTLLAAEALFRDPVTP